MRLLGYAFGSLLAFLGAALVFFVPWALMLPFLFPGPGSAALTLKDVPAILAETAVLAVAAVGLLWAGMALRAGGTPFRKVWPLTRYLVLLGGFPMALCGLFKLGSAAFPAQSRRFLHAADGQLYILNLGIAFVWVMHLFPPWLHRVAFASGEKGRWQPSGHSFFRLPPQVERPSPDAVEVEQTVDRRQLLLQDAGVAVMAAAYFLYKVRSG